MFQGLVSTAHRWLGSIQRKWRRSPPELPQAPRLPEPPQLLEPLQRVVLTEQVSHTLFEEYAAHRAGKRGDEEIGWVLLGVREIDHAVVLAKLPAGSQRQAGVAHVMFDEMAQAVACRILRQQNKRLQMLGVVHTHPGSLRQPSDGDFEGDSRWVAQLRGGEGIFGIGTADGSIANESGGGKHVQSTGGLNLHWYVLGASDTRYRPLEVQVTSGVDLALPLHKIWTTIETFAGPLERLCVQQASVSLQVMNGECEPGLLVRLKLADEDSGLHVVLRKPDAACYLQRGQALHSVALASEPLDRGIYLLLADLAKSYSTD